MTGRISAAILAVLFLVTSLPATASDPRPARPIGNPQAWVPVDSLPRDVNLLEDRAVRFLLTVSPEGRTSDCQIVATSGLPRLDHLTCTFLRRRARFVHATDPQGRPVQGGYGSQVIWYQPDSASKRIVNPPYDLGDPAILPQAPQPLVPAASWIGAADYPAEANGSHGTVRTELWINNAGLVVGCAVLQSSGSLALDRQTCLTLLVRAKFPPLPDGPFHGRRLFKRTVVWQGDAAGAAGAAGAQSAAQATVPAAKGPVPVGQGLWVGNADYPLEQLTARIPAQLLLGLSVSADGSVLSCSVPGFSGPAAFVDAACAAAQRRARFHAASDANGNPVASFYYFPVFFRP